MWELYLITRLDDIKACLVIALTISVIVLAGALIGYLIERSEGYEASTLRNVSCYSCIALAFSMIMFVATPTKKDALLILGLGTTIDYLQSNEKVQELPDKCVDALDAWLDSLNK